MKQTPSEYLHNKEKQESLPFVIKNGVGKYILNGTEYDRKEIEAMLPIGSEVRLPDRRYCREDIDSKRRALR